MDLFGGGGGRRGCTPSSLSQRGERGRAIFHDKAKEY